MSSSTFEAFLAKIYVDAKARERFLSDPLGEASRAGLSLEEAQAMQNIDRVGLELASRSFGVKRRRRFKSRPWLQVFLGRNR